MDTPDGRRGADLIRLLERFQNLKSLGDSCGIDVSVFVHGKIVNGHAEMDHINVLQHQVRTELHDPDLIEKGAGYVVQTVFAFDKAVWLIETGRCNVTFRGPAIYNVTAANKRIKLPSLVKL